MRQPMKTTTAVVKIEVTLAVEVPLAIEESELQDEIEMTCAVQGVKIQKKYLAGSLGIGEQWVHTKTLSVITKREKPLVKTNKI